MKSSNYKAYCLFVRPAKKSGMIKDIGTRSKIIFKNTRMLFSVMDYMSNVPISSMARKNGILTKGIILQRQFSRHFFIRSCFSILMLQAMPNRRDRLPDQPLYIPILYSRCRIFKFRVSHTKHAFYPMGIRRSTGLVVMTRLYGKNGRGAVISVLARELYRQAGECQGLCIIYQRKGTLQ